MPLKYTDLSVLADFRSHVLKEHTKMRKDYFALLNEVFNCLLYPPSSALHQKS